MGIDPSEFREFYDRYNGPIYNFFANRLFPPEECRDLVQETFYRAFRNAPNFRGEAQLGTWLMSIATNVWREETRNRSRLKRSAQELSLETLRRERGFDAAGDDSLGQLQQVLEEEQGQLLREALLELPPQMRYCIQLRVFQDLRYREIAELMQVSIGTVKSQLAKARAHLQERLQASLSVNL